MEHSVDAKIVERKGKTFIEIPLHVLGGRTWTILLKDDANFEPNEVTSAKRFIADAIVKKISEDIVIHP